MKKALSTLSLMVIVLFGSSQLTVNNGFTAQQLADNLAGSNVTTTNATIVGDPLQYGTFQFNGAGLGVNSGVILSTGSIFDAPGPNNGGNNASTAFGTPGDPDLDALAGFNTNDAAVLEFEFEVQSDRIEFNFVFMSEEYNEFVNSGFNDVFAFYISGPGITGQQNLAVVPGTTTPVTINSINNGSFWQYYNDNTAGGTNVEFDGFTTLLTAEMDSLQTCGVYTLSMRVADGSDAILDAAVLLQENSLVQSNLDVTSNTVNASGIALEGCIQASFTFQLDSALGQDTDIQFGIGGSATNGVDYQYLDSILTIPAGQTSATVFIDAFADGVTEGQESIELYFTPAPCAPPDTVTLYIDDADPIEYTLSGTDLSCFEDCLGEVGVGITGGFPPYSVTVTDTISGQQWVVADSVFPLDSMCASTYLIEIVDDFGCSAEAVVIGGDFNAGQTFLPDGTGASYTSDITISGFNAGQTITAASQIQSICATMEHSYANDLTITLESPSGQQVMLKNVGPTGGSLNACNMGEPVASGPVDNWNSSNTTPGVGYEYCWTNNPTFTTMGNEIQSGSVPQYTYTSTWGNTLTDYYLPQGSYTPVQNLSGFVGSLMNGTWTLEVTDNYALDNGYIFDWNISLTSDLPDSTITLNQPPGFTITGGVTSAACGTSDGEIDINVSGNFPPFTYQWSHGPTTEDVVGLSAGQYTVTITDANNCDYDTTFTVPNAGAVTVSSNISDVTCPGAGDGAIDLSLSGGLAPFTFSWSHGPTTEDVSGLQPGTYTVTITDANGCVAIEDITVGAVPTLSLNGAITNESCGQFNGSIDLTVTGGSGPMSVLWNTGATTEDIANLNQGTYYVDVTDANGCFASDTFTVINTVGNCQPQCDLDISNDLVTDETCGQGNGQIDITIFTSNGPYTVSWSHGPTTEDVSGLSAGTYTVTISDAEGCQVTESYTVNNATNGLAITSGNVSNEICGQANGSIDISVSGGSAPYSYSWSNGSTTQDLSGLTAGTYDVTVTDGNGCQVSQSYPLVNDAGTLQQTYGNAVDENCGQSDGSIDIIIQGGAQPYSYVWSNGATTEDLQGISAGTYQCTITDDNGCSITTPIYNVGNSGGTLTIDNIIVNNETCGNGQGNIQVFYSGGTDPETFSWNTGATTQDLFNISAGTYDLTITDANGCSVSTGPQSVINSSGNLSVDNVVTYDEICGNGQGMVDITVSGGASPVSFAWNTGSTSEDLLNVPAGNYSCTITDANGCTTSVNATVNSNSGNLAIDNMIVTDENCGDGSGAINVVVSGGNTPYSYLWGHGPTSQDLSGLNAGSYTITVTDANGCSTTSSAQVSNNSGTLAVMTASVANEVCGDGSGAIDITVSGGTTPYTYNWNTGATTEDLSSLSVGSYSCTITDNNGCSVTTGQINVGNASGGLTATIASTTDENCGDGSGAIDIDVTGGTTPYTFNWSNGGTTEDLSGLSAGTYTLDITDASGCTFQISADVLNNSGTLNIDNTSISDEVCSNGSGAIDISVSGGAAPLSFSWSNGPTTEDLSGLSSGSYSCTVTDANGCSVSTGNLTVNNASGNFVLDNVNVTDETCGDGTGEINITLLGGTPPISFNWNTGATTEDISGLSAGVYDLIATDNNGCTITLSAVINNTPGGLLVDNAQETDETCGQGNGAIDLTIVGGTPPYSFTWNTGATTEDITGLSAGNYICNIVDASGCSVNYTGAVSNQGGNLQISGTTVSDDVCGSSSGSITVNVNGGQTPYTYDWGPLGMGGSTQSGLSAGTYSVTVTDANGCSVSTSGTVGNSTGGLSIDNMVVTNDFCSSGSGAIDLQVSGGTAPYNYNWSNGGFTEDQNGLSAGTYWVDVIDGSGCSVSDTTLVTNTTNGLALTGSVTDDLCSQSAGAIDITVTGGATPYTYSWSTSATTEDLSGLMQGWYVVDVTDNSGCTLIDSFYIDNNTNGFTASSLVVDENCGDGTGSIDVTVNGGITPYSFLWDDASASTTEDLSNLNAGIYTVIISDNAGCQITLTDTVENITGGLAVTGASVDETCGAGDGSIDLTVTGGTTPYSYNWSNGATTEDLASLSSGTYSCTVTDGVGCMVTFVDTISGGQIVIDSTQVGDETCSDSTGFATVYVSGGSAPYSYSWIGFNPCCDYTIDMFDSFGDGWNGGELEVFVNGLSVGVYSAQGNGSSATFTVCNGDNIELIYTPDQWEQENTYEVYDGFGNLVFQDGPTPQPGSVYTAPASCPGGGPSINGLNAGTYQVVITDANGCTDTATAVVGNDPGSLAIGSMVVTDENCGAGDGAIDITVSGGLGTYNFDWSNGETTEDIANLSAGSYWVTVDDGTGCETTDTATVINNTAGFSITSIVGTDESCGDSTGTADLTVTGGATPYSYSWSNGETTEDLSGLTQGWYIVDVTEAGGCTITDSVYIDNVTNGLAATASVTDEVCGDGSGAIDLAVTGGSPPITFSWSNGATTEDITGLSSGVYSVTIADGTGCAMVQSYAVGDAGTPPLLSAFVSEDFCQFSNGSIDLQPQGNGPFTYQWSNGATTEDIGNLTAGTYYVDVTDANGCTATDTFTVTAGAWFQVDNANITDASCQTCADGAIDITILTAGNYVFNWSNGSTSEDQSGLTTGWYSVVIIDDNNCVVEDSFFVDVDTTLGIDVSQLGVGFEVYPNPSNGQFTIDITRGFSKDMFVEVYDMVGKLIYSEGEITSDKVTIDLGGVERGFYNVTVIKDGIRVNKRMLIQR